MPNLLAVLATRLKDNNKLAVASILIISDFICITLSAITAFQFRFPDTNLQTDSRPTIAQFNYNYRHILLLVILSWLFIFIVSGIYRFKHANLFVLNLQLVIKRSIYFFFFLGFISFILKASFSRIVFAIMLGSGLVYLLLGRMNTYFIFFAQLLYEVNQVVGKGIVIVY